MSFDVLVDNCLGTFSRGDVILSLYKYNNEFFFTETRGVQNKVNNVEIFFAKIKFSSFFDKEIGEYVSASLYTDGELFKKHEGDNYLLPCAYANEVTAVELMAGAYRILNNNRVTYKFTVYDTIDREVNAPYVLSYVYDALNGYRDDLSFYGFKKISEYQIIKDDMINGYYFGDKYMKKCYINPFLYNRSNLYEERMNELMLQLSSLENNHKELMGEYTKYKGIRGWINQKRLEPDIISIQDQMPYIKHELALMQKYASIK